MLTDTLHDTTIRAPVLVPSYHVVGGWVVDRAGLASTYLLGVGVDTLTAH